MKLKDVNILWVPVDESINNPTRRRDMVVVVPMDKDNGHRSWASTGGCYTWTQTCKDKSKLRGFALAEAIGMIVRDGLDPMAVHKAMLNVDEYLEAVASDLPGVQEKLDEKEEPDE